MVVVNEVVKEVIFNGEISLVEYLLREVFGMGLELLEVILVSLVGIILRVIG